MEIKKEDRKTDIEVSIIIISYNNFQLLNACLTSLYKYTQDLIFEVIVIDNNSSEKDIENIISNFSNVTLIQNDSNRGFAAANNQGIAIANGTYILLLNNDTILIENSILKVYQFAKTLKEDVIIGCKLLNPDGTLQHSVYDFPSVLNIFTSNFFLYLLNKQNKYFSKYHLMNRRINSNSEVDVVTGAFLFVNKSGIQKVGGFDERFYFYNEETDLCYRFKLKGGKVYYFPETKLIHIKGGTTNKNLAFKYRNESFAQIRYFQKHFKGLKFFLVICFHYIGILLRIPILFLLGCFLFNKSYLIRSYYFIKLLFLYPQNEFK